MILFNPIVTLFHFSRSPAPLTVVWQTTVAAPDLLLSASVNMYISGDDDGGITASRSWRHVASSDWHLIASFSRRTRQHWTTASVGWWLLLRSQTECWPKHSATTTCLTATYVPDAGRLSLLSDRCRDCRFGMHWRRLTNQCRLQSFVEWFHRR